MDNQKLLQQNGSTGNWPELKLESLTTLPQFSFREPLSEPIDTQTLKRNGKTLKKLDAMVHSVAVQGLFFGSSSSVMFRLFGHGIVSETYNEVQGCGAGGFISSAKRNTKAAVLHLNFQAQCAALPSCSQIQTFDFEDSRRL